MNAPKKQDWMQYVNLAMSAGSLLVLIFWIGYDVGIVKTKVEYITNDVEFVIADRGFIDRRGDKHSKDIEALKSKNDEHHRRLKVIEDDVKTYIYARD